MDSAASILSGGVLRIVSRHTITSRHLPGTPYTEHMLLLDGVELRAQLHPFSRDEIRDAIAEYCRDGTTAPRHACSNWYDPLITTATRALPGGARMGDPIRYDGLPIGNEP